MLGISPKGPPKVFGFKVHVNHDSKCHDVGASWEGRVWSPDPAQTSAVQQRLAAVRPLGHSRNNPWFLTEKLKCEAVCRQFGALPARSAEALGHQWL